MIDQDDVIQRVDSALRTNPHLRAATIRLIPTGDSMVLEGDVDSFFEKQMAQEAVRWIDGVPRIDNRLVVRPAYASTP